MEKDFLFKNIITSIENTEKTFEDGYLAMVNHRIYLLLVTLLGFMASISFMPENSKLLLPLLLGFIGTSLLLLYFLIRMIIYDWKNRKQQPNSSSYLLNRAYFQAPKISSHVKNLSEFSPLQLGEFKDWLEHTIKYDAMIIAIFAGLLTLLSNFFGSIPKTLTNFDFGEWLSEKRLNFILDLFNTIQVTSSLIIFILTIALILMKFKLPTHMRFLSYVNFVIRQHERQKT